MSVDISARLGYGYIVSNDRHREYQEKIDQINNSNYITLGDYYCYIDSYVKNSDVFYGIIIDDTSDYITIDINADLIDEKEWETFYNLFNKEFPEITENEIPQFYLMCICW